jgi:DnaK suppressor protein
MQNTDPIPGRTYLSNKRNGSNGGRSSLYESLEKTLRTRLEELQRHVWQLRGEMQIDDEVDDDATHAIRSTNRDIIMLTMEREIRNIAEIEQALVRIKKSVYGICSACEEEIPVNRLRAIPWTRLCVDCAGGGIKPKQEKGGIVPTPCMGLSP